MDDGSIFMIVALIILIGLSAFFSAAETAYNSLNEIRLRSKAEDGDAKAAHTLALVERYDSLLSTILIGNNIVNIGASSLATVLFTRLVGGVYGPTVSTIVMTLLVLTFGEITPKSMAKEMPETLAMGFAPVLSALVTIFTPLNALFGAWKKFLAKRFDTGEKDTITEGELVTMVSEAEKDGELTNRESELIRSAIEFDDVEAQDVLTPRVDVVAVADDTPMDEVTERFAESGYSRLPVYHDTIDNIIGVVHEKDCFAALQKHDKNVKLEDLIGPTLYTTSVTQISALLRTLRESKHHMAVVVDEYGGTAGIITLEDILEELVGEIWDEHDDVVEDVRQQSDGSWLISGSASVDDTADELGIKEDELSENSRKAYSEMLHSIGDFERVGDYAENLLEFYEDMQERGTVFSQEAISELRVMSQAVEEIVSLTVQAYEQNDATLARQVEPLEDVIDSIKEALKSRHISRLQSGICTVNTGIPFLDIIHDYEKISDHCSNVAVYVMMLADTANQFDVHEYRKILKDLRTDEFQAFTSLYENKYLNKVI